MNMRIPASSILNTVKLDIHLESDESHLSPKSVPQIIYLLLFIYSFSYIYLLFIHRLYVCIYIDYIV